ncbi:peptidylprolyl isomerase [Streptomyces monticola]|uniref:Peptidyl-prolyl cis-trans isomerase n=1 Tax=Streptomyces monticola TaxID=2666263 RepID=A0ABW2JDZ0_9ACTN
MTSIALRCAAGAALATALIYGPAAPSSAAPAPAAAPAECLYNPAQHTGAPKDLGTPSAKPAHAGPVKATLKTNRGDINLDLDGEKAPCAVNSFTFLAQKNFFDKTDCHRLANGPGMKMLQCGDPTGTGSGGPGYEFANENTGGATYPKGTVAMANEGPDTNGSQFFLVYGDSQLPPDYTPFGKITSGIDLLEAVGEAGDDGSSSAGGGKPRMNVGIEDVVIAQP